MSRKTKIPAWMDGPDHPDAFPIVCALSSVPVCIMDVETARRFLERMAETRERLETAIRIEQEWKGGDA